MLTDTAARKAKAATKSYKLADSGGLFLFVTPAGGKLWRLKYRFNGKEKLLSIGPYPDVSLADARAERDNAKTILRENRDPAVVKEQKRSEAKTTAERTFEPIARMWHDIQKITWTDGYADEVIDAFEADIFPEIGHLPIRGPDRVTAANILAALRKIEARGAIETARRARTRISNVFVYAIASGFADDDPASSLGKALSPTVKRQHPGLVDLDQVRQVLRDTDNNEGTGVTARLAMRLLALTFVRSGVLVATPWEEFPPGETLWKIPAARMKLKKHLKKDPTRDHWVPLPTQAIETIEAIRTITGRVEYVFPAKARAYGHMAGRTLDHMLESAGYTDRHVPHGWRTSFSTIMNERYPEQWRIIDFMLAHVPKDRTERAYNRAAYIEQRTELAQIWADKLMVDQKPLDDLLSEWKSSRVRVSDQQSTGRPQTSATPRHIQ